MALDPATWDEACRRRAAGESIRAIATSLGVSASHLGKKFANAGAVAKKKPPAHKPAAKAKSKPRSAAVRKHAPPPARTRPRDGSSVRRQLISRLYRAIDTKLKLMEARMNSEIDAIDSTGGNTAGGDDTAGSGARNSADHERETRAFGALVKTINSVRQMQAELDSIANAHTASTAAPSAADARLAADAERYRRDIAERLAKFVPPQS